MTFEELAKDNSFMQLWFENQTGYDVSRERTEREIKSAKKSFEEFCETQILSETFARDYEKHFVHLRQLSKLSYEECELKMKELERFGRIFATDRSRTFFEWLAEFEKSSWKTLTEADPSFVSEKWVKKEDPIVDELEEAAKKWTLTITDSENPIFGLLVEAFKAGWLARSRK